MTPEAEASRNASRVRSDWEPCTVFEPRRRVCNWLGQQCRRDSTRVGAPSCSDAEVSGVVDKYSGLVGGESLDRNADAEKKVIILTYTPVITFTHSQKQTEIDTYEDGKKILSS